MILAFLEEEVPMAFKPCSFCKDRPKVVNMRTVFGEKIHTFERREL